jgi:chorismate mutase
VDRDEAAFEATGRSRREDRRIQQLLRERAELREQVGSLQQQRDTAVRAVQRNTAQTIDSDIAAVQEKLKQAFLDGDADAHTLAQTQLASLVNRREAIASQPHPQGGTQAPAVSAETQDWIARNPRFTSDDAWRGEALKAHTAAVHLGYAVDEPDYFRFVEEQI